MRIAEYLIEHEAVSGDDLQRLFNGEELGGGEDPGTPAVPPETPPYAPKPAQPNVSPQPAPSLSSQNAQDVGTMSTDG